MDFTRLEIGISILKGLTELLSINLLYANWAITTNTKITIKSLLVKGDEAGAIIGISEAQDINLIVMTKHCQADTQQNLLGDITERVLHHASCPVMVICSNLLAERAVGSDNNPDQTANTPYLIQT